MSALHRGGSGPPLVLLHGLTDTRRTWEHVIPALSRRHEVRNSGRRRATGDIPVRFEHIPADLVAHQIRGAAACDVPSCVERALRDRWHLDAERIDCPVRVVRGVEDRRPVAVGGGATG